LLGIIDDILSLTKIEAGKLELRSAPFNIRSLISGVMRLLQPAADQKRLGLREEINGDLPATLVGDEGRLRQVLMNLVGNAVKFTDAGEVSVRTSFTPRGSDRILLQISVQDTGVGIPPARQNELFVPFSQLDTTAARRLGGTGLGLVISRRLCDLMGGTISVHSDGVSGSTFTFTVDVGVARLPERTVLPSSGASVARAAVVAALEPAGGAESPLRILLVEDNPVNALVARRMLGKLGYRPDEAKTGHEAIAACRVNAYDVILMDLQMPELDGLAATAAIRSLPLPVQPRIVAVTAEAMDGDRDRCLAAGMDDYISKPLTIHGLAEQLTRVASRGLAATAQPVRG
jgi:CheY-like chemotaxis protein